MSAESARAPGCPKCSHQGAPGAAACPRCGLTFALWSPPPDAPAPATLDEQGEALWAETLAGWDAPERHDTFLKHCAVTGGLGAAGRRYRQRLDQDPTDAMAGKMQSRVLAMAAAAFVRTPAAATPFTRSTWFWLVVVGCAVVGMIGALLRRW
jgi:hypothetical protein